MKSFYPSILLLLGLCCASAQTNLPNLGLTQLPFNYPHYENIMNGNLGIIDNIFPSTTCGGDGIHSLTYNAGTKKFGCTTTPGGGNIGGSLTNVNIIPRVTGVNTLGDGSLIDDGNGVITTNKNPLQFNFGGTNFQFNTGNSLLEWVGANYDVQLDGSTGLITFQTQGLTISGSPPVNLGAGLINFPGLSPSLPMCTDSSRNATSVCTAGNLSTSGTPLTGQIAVFTDTTHVQGVTGFTFDPVTGNLVVPGTITAGAPGVAGLMAWKYGTVPTLITGGITEYAAASGTDFSLIKPSAPSSGYLKWTNAAGIVTESIANPISVQLCGTTTACAKTAQTAPIIVYGTVALVSASPSTATLTALPFTSTSSYVCTGSPVGATAAIAAGGIAFANASASSTVLTGPNTVTTVINYQCTGN